MHHGSACEVGLYLLPTGGNPAAAWAGTASACGWSPRSGWLSGPAPWCRRFAVHQSIAGSSDPPPALRPQSQKNNDGSLRRYHSGQLLCRRSSQTHWYWRGPAPSCRGTPPRWPSACRTSGPAASSARSVRTCWTTASARCMKSSTRAGRGKKEE